MHHFAAAIAGLAIVSAPLQAQRAEGDARSLDQAVHDMLSAAITPGAVVAVVIRDSVVLINAYGRTALDASAPPLSPDAVFRAGALSELVTALAASHLAHTGGLSMDAPLGTLISELPRELRDVTAAQLLTHTAGVAHQEAVPGRGGADDLGAAARGLTRYDRFAPAGALYSFSTPGIQLAGLAVERAAKRPFAAAVHELVLEPLGMLHSTFDFAAARPSLTPGYHPSSSPDAMILPAAFEPDTAMRAPVRGFITTAADAARLAAALLNDGVVAGERALPAGVTASLLEPRAAIPFSRSKSARGMRVGSWNVHRSVYISGGGMGHGFSMHMLPDQRVAVIVLTNKSGSTLGGLSDFVFRRLLGSAPPRPPENAASDSASLEQLAAAAGSYVNGSELIEIITREGLPMLRSDDLTLHIRVLERGGFAALIDNRVALPFRLIRDDNGRPYLWLGDRALAREDPE